MCFSARKTTRRGRACVPDTFFRTRRCRRSRCAAAVLALLILLASRLTGLPANDFALVFDALSFIWLGRPQIADFGGNLTNLFFVRAVDHDRRRLRRAELHAGRRLELDRVREAARQL